MWNCGNVESHEFEFAIYYFGFMNFGFITIDSLM